jgi:hypothetical protein
VAVCKQCAKACAHLDDLRKSLGQRQRHARDLRIGQRVVVQVPARKGRSCTNGESDIRLSHGLTQRKPTTKRMLSHPAGVAGDKASCQRCGRQLHLAPRQAGERGLSAGCAPNAIQMRM